MNKFALDRTAVSLPPHLTKLASQKYSSQGVYTPTIKCRRQEELSISLFWCDFSIVCNRAKISFIYCEEFLSFPSCCVVSPPENSCSDTRSASVPQTCAVCISTSPWRLPSSLGLPDRSPRGLHSPGIFKTTSLAAGTVWTPAGRNTP